jgi:hypothetical protein
VELKLELPTSLRAELTIICHKRMADLPKVRIVLDLLRQEFAELRKNKVTKNSRTESTAIAKRAKD